jgi:hypothetical protein
LQQLREALGYEDRYRYLIHDRDGIFAKNLDESIGRLGLKVLKTPFRSPMANAMCERSIGTIRRECLDWLIPMSEAHLRAILKDWRTHYNGSRPHMALGPGVPDPPAKAATSPAQQSRHRIREGFVLLASRCSADCITSTQSHLRSRDLDIRVAQARDWKNLMGRRVVCRAFQRALDHSASISTRSLLAGP